MRTAVTTGLVLAACAAEYLSLTVQEDFAGEPSQVYQAGVERVRYHNLAVVLLLCAVVLGGR